MLIERRVNGVYKGIRESRAGVGVEIGVEWFVAICHDMSCDLHKPSPCQIIRCRDSNPMKRSYIRTIFSPKCSLCGPSFYSGLFGFSRPIINQNTICAANVAMTLLNAEESDEWSDINRPNNAYKGCSTRTPYFEERAPGIQRERQFGAEKKPLELLPIMNGKIAAPAGPKAAIQPIEPASSLFF